MLFSHGNDERGCANVNARNRYDDTALLLCATVGDVKCMELVIAKGGDVNVKNNSMAKVILHYGIHIPPRFAIRPPVLPPWRADFFFLRYLFHFANYKIVNVEPFIGNTSTVSTRW